MDTATPISTLQGYHAEDACTFQRYHAEDARADLPSDCATDEELASVLLGCPVAPASPSQTAMASQLNETSPPPRQDDGAADEELAKVNEFLGRIPSASRILFGDLRTLHVILRGEAKISASPGTSGDTSSWPSDLPANVTVLEPGQNYIIKHTLRTLGDAQIFFRSTRRPKSGVYLVDVQSLSEALAGLLGAYLNLDPDLFALHVTNKSRFMLDIPSKVAKRGFIQLNYRRISLEGKFETERASLSMHPKHADQALQGKRKGSCNGSGC
jgi:hypothetical protein